jgi:hypothetical protein
VRCDVILGCLCGRALALALLLPGLLAGCGGGDSKTLAEKMAGDPEKEALEKAGYKANPKPRPTGLPPPTDAEFAAWDRKDPEGERHLHKFDKANLKKLLNFWAELDCFREKMKSEGAKAVGVEPGQPGRRAVASIQADLHPDGQRLAAAHVRQRAADPREIQADRPLPRGPRAGDERLPGRLQQQRPAGDRHRRRPVDHRREQDHQVPQEHHHGGAPKEDLTDPKVKEKHDKFCMAALNPPKNTGKAKVKHVGGGGNRGPEEAQHGRRLSR